MVTRTNVTVLTLVITLVALSFSQTSYGAARPEKPPKTADTKEIDVLDTIIDARPLESKHFDLKSAYPRTQEITDSNSELSFAENHLELINMLRSLLHIPYIVTIDSKDPKAIGASALLSALATDSRLLYELFHNRKNTTLFGDLIWYLPKAAGYSAGALYEYGRFSKAAEIAEKNKVFSKQLRNLKIQQTIQLILELCLRGLAYKVALSNPHQKDSIKHLSEIADIIELWRLLSRYNTFFIESEQPVHVFPVQTTPEEPAIA